MFSILYKRLKRLVSARLASERYFQMNSRASRECEGFTLKKRSARNVCHFSQNDTDTFSYGMRLYSFIRNKTQTAV